MLPDRVSNLTYESGALPIALRGPAVISGLWGFDNERLFAMESHLQSKSFPPTAGLEHGTSRSVDQGLTYSATGAPHHFILCP